MSGEKYGVQWLALLGCWAGRVIVRYGFLEAWGWDPWLGVLVMRGSGEAGLWKHGHVGPLFLRVRFVHDIETTMVQNFRI